MNSSRFTLAHMTTTTTRTYDIVPTIDVPIGGEDVRVLRVRITNDVYEDGTSTERYHIYCHTLTMSGEPDGRRHPEWRHASTGVPDIASLIHDLTDDGGR